jgi:archaetidylinositol phosphate synthase
MGALRLKRNLLRQREALAIGYFVRRLPAGCAPDQLTALSVGGAIVAGLSLMGCRLSGWFVLPALAGLFLNWFGDSLDGALARFRQLERPHAGYMIDRGADIVSFTAIIIGLGLSPYFTLLSALMLLLVYLLHTVYALLRNVVDGVHVLGLGGVGATEGRILVGAWAFFAQFAGPAIAMFRFDNIVLPDVFNTGLLAGAVAMFVFRLLGNVRRIEAGSANGNVVRIAPDRSIASEQRRAIGGLAIGRHKGPCGRAAREEFVRSGDARFLGQRPLPTPS